MPAAKPVICVFGLGEAGGLIAADLAKAGARVQAYDPAPVETPAGVERYDSPQAAVAAAATVIALTAAADARDALEQAFDEIPSAALYADFATAAPALKRELDARCAGRGLEFADVALMAIVPGNGIRTPALVSGAGAVRFVDLFSAFGMPCSAGGAEAGDAAGRKLLRSVMMKGLAAVVIEAMEAAEKAGCADWLWQNLAEQIARADGELLARLVRGTHRHAARRLHEMEASAELLDALGVEPMMTRATVLNLRKVLDAWPAVDEAGGIDAAALPAWWRNL